jgi:hypothetical protein
MTLDGWEGWVLVVGVIIGILLRSADLEAKRRRRQEANRKRLRLDGPEAYVSAAEADAYYRESERLRLALGGPPAHPQCRCTLAPIDAGPLTASINRHTLDLGVPADKLEEMLTDVGRRIRRDLIHGLEPSELEVNRVLKELERLASSEE